MNKLDSTLDEVQNARFHTIYHGLIRQMTKKTQFSETEVSSILLIYHKHVLANGPKAKSMTKKQFFQLFLVLFRIYDLEIIERILVHLTSDSKKEVDPVAWVRLFSIFMSEDLEKKMRFVFEIYDTRHIGALNREVVTLAVGKFFTGDDEDEINEMRADMVDLLFKKFDIDKDGNISFEDYSTVVRKQPLLLEFLGTCLPSTNGKTLIAYCANIISSLPGREDLDI